MLPSLFLPLVAEVKRKGNINSRGNKINKQMCLMEPSKITEIYPNTHSYTNEKSKRK